MSVLFSLQPNQFTSDSEFETPFLELELSQKSLLSQKVDLVFYPETRVSSSDLGMGGNA